MRRGRRWLTRGLGPPAPRGGEGMGGEALPPPGTESRRRGQSDGRGKARAPPPKAWGLAELPRPGRGAGWGVSERVCVYRRVLHRPARHVRARLHEESKVKASLKKASQSLAPFNNYAGAGCVCVIKRPKRRKRDVPGWFGSSTDVQSKHRPKRSTLGHHGRSVTCREGMKSLGPPLLALHVASCTLIHFFLH